MAASRRLLTRLFLSMIKVAEARGGIPETLRMLSRHYEARQSLIRQARSAMIYPIIVLLVATCVVALMTIWLLPMFISHAQGHRRPNAILPLPSRDPDGLQRLRAEARLVAGAPGRDRRPAGRLPDLPDHGRQAHDGRVALWVPVLGMLLRKIDTTRFARTLASLLGAGVDIGSSLDLTADVMQLDPFRRTIRKATASGDGRERAERGPERLAPVRPRCHRHHQLGRGDRQAPREPGELADDYEEQVAYMVKNMGQLIQPLLMVVLGGIVLFIILAFFCRTSRLLPTWRTDDP